MKAKQNYATGLEKAFKYKRGKRNYFFAEVSNRKNIQSTNSPQIKRNIFYFISSSAICSKYFTVQIFLYGMWGIIKFCRYC